MSRTPSALFFKIDLPDAVDERTNWINPGAIAMVSRKARGNQLWVKILWISGHSTNIEGADALAFLATWEGKNASTKL